jgi:FOG: PKD repeat
MSDGSIVLMGGSGDAGNTNDTWRSTDNGATWTEMNPSSGWSERFSHTSVVNSGNTIFLMGGAETTHLLNDTWRSSNYGASWTLVNASSGWPTRFMHSSVVLGNNNIILMGGVATGGGYLNDTWKSTDNGATWIEMNASSGWSARENPVCVSMSDGSIVLMGGSGDSGRLNDVWRSTDEGATWTRVNPNSDWSAREMHSGGVMPEGSIVVMGGNDGGLKNDTWILALAGSSAQNPVHIFTSMGSYNVALTARDASGYNTLLMKKYIAASDLQAAFTWACNATVPYQVDFHDTSTTSFPPIESLWWNFGDGSGMNYDESAPMHTYSGIATFTVNLTSWDSLGAHKSALVAVTPCTASNVIRPGGTVFIGESGLDITAAVPAGDYHRLVARGPQI